MAGAGNEHDGAAIPLDQPRSDDPDHTFVPALVGDDVAPPLAPLRRPALDLLDRGPNDALLDSLAVTVQLLEAVGEPGRLVRIVGEQQLQRRLRMAQAARRVHTGRKAECDGALVDRRRVDAGRTHQRDEARTVGGGEPLEAGDDERPVLVDERDDVGDRRQRDEVEVALESRNAESLGELVDDAGAAELGKRVLGRARGDDRTVGQPVARPVMVGDDDLEPEAPRSSTSSAAVMPQSTVSTSP